MSERAKWWLPVTVITFGRLIFGFAFLGSGVTLFVTKSSFAQVRSLVFYLIRKVQPMPAHAKLHM